RPFDVDHDRGRAVSLREATRLETAGPGDLSLLVPHAVERAKRDLAALRLDDLDHGAHAWTIAAGVPGYMTLFGRDTLTAAWQASIVSTEIMRGTLLELPRWQGTEADHWR